MKKKKRTIVMMGDSITDSGYNRDNPTQEYGTGYVAMTAAMLRQRLPEYDLTIVNRGIGGDCAWQNRDRWDTDVMAYQPDYLTWMIGVNDAHVHGVIPQTEEVKLHAYFQIVDDLVKKTLPGTCKKILFLSPYYIGTKDDKDSIDFVTMHLVETLPPYIRAFRRIAAKYGMPFIETQSLFQKARKTMPGLLLAPDFVHPTTYGHALLALHTTDRLVAMIREEEEKPCANRGSADV